MKHTRSVLFLSALAVIGVGCAAVLTPGVRASSSAPQAAAETGSAERGEKLFASSCAFCHGPTGKGSATGVSLIDSSMVRHDKGGNLIGPVVLEGRIAKGMPAFSVFDAGQVADLAAFLHARITLTDSVETAGPRGGYQLQNLLTGSVPAGKQFFDGAGGCSKCHSATGDLAGIAKRYQPTELEARFLYPRNATATVTVTLPSGEKVKGTLQHHDPFYVALVDAQGRYRSWKIPGVQVAIDDPLQAHVALLDRYTNKDVHDVFAYLETLQ